MTSAGLGLSAFCSLFYDGAQLYNRHSDKVRKEYMPCIERLLHNIFKTRNSCFLVFQLEKIDV